MTTATHCITPRGRETACVTPRATTVLPRADVWESEDAAHLAIELPGVPATGLELRVEGDRLTVAGTVDLGAPEGRLLFAEWQPRSFQRSFVLTDDADRDAISAQLKDGVLHVRVPRRAERRPRTIDVRVAAD